jgi:serine/threonine protein phosphatase PrpC
VIPTEKSHLTVAALSHPGENRENNEDRYAVESLQLERDGTPILLAVVADGIGGHQAGEIAAQITVDTIRESLSKSNTRNPVSDLGNAVIEASRKVSQASQQATEKEGMGSTVAVVWIIGPHMYTTSVGDSRIYLLRDGRLRQISVDHTWVQEAMDYDIIGPEEARHHPQAHVLRRYIGGPQLPEPDMRLRLEDGENDQQSRAHQGLNLRRGDKILLCSDGLTDLVEDQEIYEALNTKPPERTVNSLVDLARARGGHDNITVIALAVPEKMPEPRRRSRTPWLVGLVAGIVAVLCLTLAGLALMWLLGFWPWDQSAAGLGTQPETYPSPTALAPGMNEVIRSPESTDLTTFAPTETAVPAPTSTAYPLPTVPLPTTGAE